MIVCDDGSSDATGEHAAAARVRSWSPTAATGARPLRSSRPSTALGVLEQRDRLPEAGSLLLLDADLGESAANCAPLIDPVVAGAADLTIAVLPAQQTADGGDPAASAWYRHRRRGIAELTGWTPRAPLSGQRCLTRRAFELASPLAAGWGMEVGMTVDVLRAGLDGSRRSRSTCGTARPAVTSVRQLHRANNCATSRGPWRRVAWSRQALKDLKDSGGVSGLLKRLRR